MQKLHILHVVGSTDRNGAGVAASVCELCSALADITEVTILAGKGKGAHYPVDARVRRVLCPSRGIAGLRLSLAVGFRNQLEAVLAEGVDLVHIHGLWMAEVHLACAAARRRGIPYVVSTHGMLMPWAFRHKAWKKFLPWRIYQRRDLRQAAAVVTTSEAEAASVRAFGFPGQVVTIPHGLNVPPWQELRNGHPPRKVIFLGRLHPIKGLMNLVDAWSAVRPKDWQLILAGPDEGGFQLALMERIRQHNITDTVTFTGPLDDPQKWQLLRQADLFVLPSFMENFGLVVLESLACGVPVIATKGTPWAVLEGSVNNEQLAVSSEQSTGNREQLAVSSGEIACHPPPTTAYRSPLTAHSSSPRCGWWVDLGAESLATALDAAMSLADDERRAMGRRGRELVEQQYAWGAIARRIMDLYGRVRGM